MGGGGEGEREREKKGNLRRKKREEAFDKFKMVLYTSTLSTTLYVGQGQNVLFVFCFVLFLQSTNNRLK